MPASKWSSLQARFMMRSQFGGPCPEPHFTGSQEFFRDFLSDSTYSFIHHFKDLLIHFILKANETPFNIEEELPKSEIAKTIQSLRISAKFLAFIETMPYRQCGPNVSAKIIERINAQRSAHKPVIDLKKLIKNAFEKQRLIITLPWIIEFCAFLDSCSVKLPYYLDAFKLLIHIYRNHLNPDAMKTFPKLAYESQFSEISDLEESPVKKIYRKSSKIEHVLKISPFHAFFLSVYLGWLFENSMFPRELFIVEDLDVTLPPRIPKNASLDASKGLKFSLFLNCCPYINELKVILCQFHTGFKASKVMPTKTGNNSSKKELKLSSRKKSISFNETMMKSPQIKPENMQSALEANFFHNQPAAVKDTVERVTDRITSNFVRILSHELIANNSKSVMSQISANLQLLCTDLETLDQMKEELLSQVSEMAEQAHKKIQIKGYEIIDEQLVMKVKPVINGLLSDDTKEPVIEFCSQIIEKRIKQNAEQWMVKNMSRGNLFLYGFIY